MANVKFQKCSSSSMRFIEVVEEIFRKCQTEEVHQFAGIVRRLWLKQNEIVHGGPFQHPNLLLQHAVSAAEEFAAIHVTTNQLKNRWTEACQKWRAPTPGWVKLNWDASMEVETGQMGYGALIQDERGLVVAAQCQTFVGRLEPVLAEAGAASMAIRLYKLWASNGSTLKATRRL
jgi:hypothetical protein